MIVHFKQKGKKSSRNDRLIFHLIEYDFYKLYSTIL